MLECSNDTVEEKAAITCGSEGGGVESRRGQLLAYSDCEGGARKNVAWLSSLVKRHFPQGIKTGD